MRAGAPRAAEPLRHRLPEAQRHLRGHRVAVGDAADAVSSEQLPALLVGHGFLASINHVLRRFGDTERRRASRRHRGRARPPRRPSPRRSPPPPSRTAVRPRGLPVSWPMNALRDTPTISGHVQAGVQRRQRAQQREVVLQALAEADARDRPRSRSSRRRARRQPLGELVRRPRRPRRETRRRPSSSRARRAGARARSPAPVSAATRHDLRVQPAARHVVDHRRARRDRRARRARLVGVDRDARPTAAARRAAPRSPAAPAPLSSASDTGAAPGRVDSPPDVDPVRPLFGHARARRHRRLDDGVPPAVRERIRACSSGRRRSGQATRLIDTGPGAPGSSDGAA